MIDLLVEALGIDLSDPAFQEALARVEVEMEREKLDYWAAQARSICWYG